MAPLSEVGWQTVHAVRTPGAKNDRRELRREVETEQRDTPRGTVTLRRTTIEEIEIDTGD